MAVEFEKRAAILVVMLRNEPVNALSAAVRTGISRALDEVDRDEAVEGLIIASALGIFSAGADINEFALPPVEPHLPDVLVRLAQARVPPVAAIDGAALGGGCELALACDFRIVGRNASFALPEVKLGLILGAGGTQRLPRLVGVPQAAEMIVSGKRLDAATACKLGLADRFAEADVLDEAIRFLEDHGGEVSPRRRTQDLAEDPGDQWFESFEHASRSRSRGQRAPQRALEALRASTRLPLAEGLELERKIFLECKADVEHRAMRYAFGMQRALRTVPGLDDVQPRNVASVGVVGAGQMGAAIALTLLEAGYGVTLCDAHTIEPGLKRITQGIRRKVDKGQLQESEAEQMLARLQPAEQIDRMNAGQSSPALSASSADGINNIGCRHGSTPCLGLE